MNSPEKSKAKAQSTGNPSLGSPITLDWDTVYRKYDFRWEVLDVILGGKSLIDTTLGLTGFPMKDREDATRFMQSYGYDLDDPIENAEVLGNFHEAINFVRKHFLQPENPDGLRLEIPRKILEITDIRDLLQMASMSYPGQMRDTQGTYLANWACSLLKVVHTIAHIDKDLRMAYFSDIQKQILDRFYKVIHRDGDGKLFLGERPNDPMGVELLAFETKSRKARESLLLKLLHKPENVAEDIFDQLGIRFVTKTPLDAIRVVKFLKDATVVVPANIKPSRSRNTLFNVEAFKNPLRDILARISRKELEEDDVRRELESLTQATGPAGAISTEGPNPHTSEHYRALQFTCRQLIKLKNPLFEDIKALKQTSKNEPMPGDVQKIIERINLKYVQREVRFFYPYEVQVMDQTSAEENEKGLSAHSEYKKAQVLTAMGRVLGNLMETAQKQ